jgi:hypothetical protein
MQQELWQPRGPCVGWIGTIINNQMLAEVVGFSLLETVTVEAVGSSLIETVWPTVCSF